MTATGPIATFGALVAGTGYANGVFTSPLIYAPGASGTGKNAQAKITVSGNVVTAVALTSSLLDRTGQNYAVGDVLTAPNKFDGAGGAGSGFTIAVGTLAPACENCFYGKIIPPTALQLAGSRYCGNTAFAPLGSGGPINWNVENTAGPSNICADDYWCAEGADKATLISFATGITGLPTTVAVGASNVPWVEIAPLVNAQAGAITTSAAVLRWTTIGKVVFVRGLVSITNAGTGTGYAWIALPAAAKDTNWSVAGVETASSKACAVFPGTVNRLYMLLYDGTTIIGNGNAVAFSGTYEAA